MIIFIVLWIVAITLVCTTQCYAWLLLPYGVFLVEELVFYYLGKELLFSNADRVETLYDMVSIGQSYLGNVDDNLTEGYYTNEIPVGPRQAEQQKFDHILSLLQAQPGEVILNMGCGACNFEIFCKQRGIRMIGVSLSTEQKRICKSKGAEMIVGDFTKFNPELVGIADHIITIGTFEHIVGEGGISLSAYKSKANKVSDVFKMYRRYFKPNGRKHRIVCSVLHQNNKYMNDWAMVPLHRGVGGIYFLDDPEFSAAWAAQKAGYSVTYWKDYSRHYYMATILDPKHFGNTASPFGFASLFFLAGIFDPYIMYLWWFSVFGSWMYMWDGQYHFANNPKYSLAPVGQRPCPLYYGVFETSV